MIFLNLILYYNVCAESLLNLDIFWGFTLRRLYFVYNLRYCVYSLCQKLLHSRYCSTLSILEIEPKVYMKSKKYTYKYFLLIILRSKTLMCQVLSDYIELFFCKMIEGIISSECFLVPSLFCPNNHSMNSMQIHTSTFWKSSGVLLL